MGLAAVTSLAFRILSTETNHYFSTLLERT